MHIIDTLFVSFLIVLLHNTSIVDDVRKMKGTSVILAVALALICAANALEYPAKEQYVLQRSFDGTLWEDRATVIVSRTEAGSPARLKVTPSTSSAVSLDAILPATLLMYRAVKSDNVVAASLVTTPCALLRGFEAISSTSINLPEVIGVVVTEGVHISGLQLSPSSNTHHNSMKASDCDNSVLSLFRNIDAVLSVTLIKPIVPRSVSNFDDAPMATGAQPTPVKKAPEGATGDQKPPQEEDNRSFFEKYWWYIVLFGLYTVVNGFLSPKGQPATKAAK